MCVHLECLWFINIPRQKVVSFVNSMYLCKPDRKGGIRQLFSKCTSVFSTEVFLISCVDRGDEVFFFFSMCENVNGSVELANEIEHTYLTTDSAKICILKELLFTYHG